MTITIFGKSPVKNNEEKILDEIKFHLVRLNNIRKASMINPLPANLSGSSPRARLHAAFACSRSTYLYVFVPFMHRSKFIVKGTGN